MEQLEPTDVTYLFNQMNRCLLVEQCHRKLHEAKRPEDKTMCAECNKPFVFEAATADMVCMSCGFTKHILTDDVFDHSTMCRYNRNPVHHYATAEHFFQSLSDLACLGRRTVPVSIMSLCTRTLGRGTMISNVDVFGVLKAGGHTRYYTSKYEIAKRLRGKAEVKINSDELELIRFHYMRYNRQFMYFQQDKRIGIFSKKGRLRLYWPVRYIMAKMFELIGRADATVHIKGISGSTRKKNYDLHWEGLKSWVDTAEAVVGDPLKPIGMRKLGKTSRHLGQRGG
jgi:hypothetical protein